MILARDQLAQEQGYIDDQGRREFIRFGIAAFLASLLNAHVALLSILFAQSGHSLHTTGWLLSLFVVPVIGINLLAGPIAARIGVLATARLSFSSAFLAFVHWLSPRRNFGVCWPRVSFMVWALVSFCPLS